MIQSLFDTDIYKFSMSYAAMVKYPLAEARFAFTDRAKVSRSPEFLSRFIEEMKKAQDITFSQEQFDWACKTIPYIPEFYWEWLRGFRFDYNKMDIYLDDEGILHVEVLDKWYRSTLYEILVLFTVTEVQNQLNGNIEKYDETEMLRRLSKKVELSNENVLKFSEFGTRRRFSSDVQDTVCKYLKENSKYCVGTSNVHFAHKYGMRPCGTQAHEWFMAHEVYGFLQTNYLALEAWSSVFDGDLGIALTDTSSVNSFIMNFSMKLAKLLDGVRCDSGDEYEFTEKMIKRYQELGINPLSKTIIYSNALDFEKALNIQKHFEGRIQTSFGIGTNLTNDTGFRAENIVMKMKQFRMTPRENFINTIKISDDAGKHMGPEEEIRFAKHVLGIK